MSATGDVELRSRGYQVLRRPWEITGRDDEIILEVKKQWTHAVCPSTTSGMKYSGIEEYQRRTDSRDGPPWVVKETMKDITFWHV